MLNQSIFKPFDESAHASLDLSHAQKNQQAIALTYGTGDHAPKVVAKGRGAVAEQIIALAKEHNVFVHESKDLVNLLMQVDLDDHIPPELYLAVAEILAWIYRLEEEKAQQNIFA